MTAGPASPRRTASDDGRLRVGAIELDLVARTASIEERPLDLTFKEFGLLAYLAARPGEVFSREQLLGAVWQSTSAWQQDATVTEHIGRLRAKIEVDPRHPRILATVRGSGYRLDAQAGDALPAPPVRTIERPEDRTVMTLVRGLLRAAGPSEAVALLQEAIRVMGGRIVSEAGGGGAAIEIDVTLEAGHHRTLFVLPESDDARTELERLLPLMSEDAASAAEALRTGG